MKLYFFLLTCRDYFTLMALANRMWLPTSSHFLVSVCSS